MYIGPWQEYAIAKNRESAASSLRTELQRRLSDSGCSPEELQRLKDIIEPVFGPVPLDAVFDARKKLVRSSRSTLSTHSLQTTRSLPTKPAQGEGDDDLGSLQGQPEPTSRTTSSAPVSSPNRATPAAEKRSSGRASLERSSPRALPSTSSASGSSRGRRNGTKASRKGRKSEPILDDSLDKKRRQLMKMRELYKQNAEEGITTQKAASSQAADAQPTLANALATPSMSKAPEPSLESYFSKYWDSVQSKNQSAEEPQEMAVNDDVEAQLSCSSQTRTGAHAPEEVPDADIDEIIKWTEQIDLTPDFLDD